MYVYADSILADVLDEKKTSEGQNIEMLHSETGSYRIQKMIGEGSFGKVVKCVNVNTSKEVAVKVLKTQNSVVNTREVGLLHSFFDYLPNLDNKIIKSAADTMLCDFSPFLHRR